MYQQPPSASPSCHVSMGPTSDSDREHDQRPERFNGVRLGQVADYKSNGCDDLIRQRSSPAGFFINQLNATSINSTLAADDDDDNNNINNGFSGPREGSGSGNSKGEIGRQNSQLSFMRQHDSILSHISEEESENGVNEHIKKTANSYGNSSSYELCSWPDDPSNSIVFFSSPSRKRAININGDAINCPNRKESQLQFGLHQSALEMCAMENLMHIPEDSVPCKIRAKRGCATHPRSIAERERRTRISGKLKKLQDLVPNMDKQTSYADMLDLAVQHIKGLQNQVQELNSELEDCKCGCNRTT